MIIHLLRIKFKDDVSDERKNEALNLISENTKLSSVAFSFIGQDLGNPAEGYTHAYCAGFENLESLKTYINEPQHTQSDFFTLPLIEKIVSVDMSDDFDPDLGKKIFEIHNTKMAENPEWAELLKSIPQMKIDS